MVSIEKVDIEKDNEVVHVKVLAGNVWLNKSTSLKSGSELLVDTNYLTIKAVGTSFGVKSGLPESVVVTDGTVLISIHEQNDSSKNVVEEINLNAGQEFIMDSVAYDAFINRETPSVVSKISTATKKTAWYKWNAEQDQNPTTLKKDSTLIDAPDEDTADLDENLVAVTNNGHGSPEILRQAS